MGDEEMGRLTKFSIYLASVMNISVLFRVLVFSPVTFESQYAPVICLPLQTLNDSGLGN